MKVFDFLLEQSHEDSYPPFSKEIPPMSTDDDKLDAADHMFEVWNSISNRWINKLDKIARRLIDKGVSGASVRAYPSYADKPDWVRIGSYFFFVDDLKQLAPQEYKLAMQMMEKYNNVQREFDRFMSERETQYRTVVMKHYEDSDRQARAIDKGLTLHDKDIPQKLPRVWGQRGTMDNPYYTSDFGQYAGDPDYFHFTREYQKNYIKFKRALRRTGIPGFTVIFAGYKDTSNRSGGQKQALNFIAYAADGRLCWKKYDVGGGSAQIKMFIDGQETWLNYNEYPNFIARARELLPEYFK